MHKQKLIELTQTIDSEAAKLTTVYLLTRLEEKPTYRSVNELRRKVKSSGLNITLYNEPASYYVLQYALRNLIDLGYSEAALKVLKAILRADTGIIKCGDFTIDRLVQEIVSSQIITFKQKGNELRYLQTIVGKSSLEDTIAKLEENILEEDDIAAERLEKMMELKLMDNVAEEIIKRCPYYATIPGTILNQSLRNLKEAYYPITYGLGQLLHRYVARQSPEYQALLGEDLSALPIIKDYEVYNDSSSNKVLIENEIELLDFYKETGMAEEEHIKSLKQLLAKLKKALYYYG